MCDCHARGAEGLGTGRACGGGARSLNGRGTGSGARSVDSRVRGVDSHAECGRRAVRRT